MFSIYVNYIAIVVVAIANMFLGFLWFGPLFGKTWTRLMGWSQTQIEEGKAKMKKDGWKTYLLAFLVSLVMACVLGKFLVFLSFYLGLTGLAAGLKVGFLSWLGFIAPVTLGSVLWEGKSWRLWFLMNSYYLVALLVMGSILAFWM